jgi:outer membrane receptor protein involved in Fe transport
MPAVYYPYISVGGSGYGKAGYWIQHPRHWTWDGSVRKMLGKHSLKTGFAHRRHKADGIFPNLMAFYAYQHFTAETFQSPDLTSYGSDYASLLLGAIDSNSYGQTFPYQYFRSNFYALFVQDDIRLTPRVTINLGLRYEYENGPYDEQDRVSRYLDLTNPIPEFQSNAPVLPPRCCSTGRARPSGTARGCSRTARTAACTTRRSLRSCPARASRSGSTTRRRSAPATPGM